MPGQPVILDTMGGLVTVARPEDIPEGASPRTYDTNYIVGRVIQRAGLQNIYSYEGISFGPNGAAIATSENLALPADAEIQGIYPVVVASMSQPGGFVNYSYSPNAGGFDAGLFYLPVPGLPSGGPVVPNAGEFYGNSIGTNLSLLAGQTFSMEMSSSIFADFAIPLNISVLAIGYAIPYTSANPIIDPQIPPPFDIPIGQGLAWALPFVGPPDASYWFGSALSSPAIINPDGTISNANGGISIHASRPLGNTGITLPWSGFSVPLSPSWMNPNNILANDGTFASATTSGTTGKLVLSNFNFTVPSTSSIIGIVVQVRGYAPSATLFAQMTKDGVPVGNTYSVVLPTSNGFVSLGGLTDTWGTTFDYTEVDATGYGMEIWATVDGIQTVALDYAEITVYGSEASVNYLGLMSVNLESIDQTTLALDANGLVFQEDVTNAPGVLSRAALIPEVVPGSYMKGVDANGYAYMAYSDLKQGTSQPMQYNGEWCDRITQVGPGQAPIFTPQQSSSDIFAITTITQPVIQTRGSSYFLQSDGPGSTSAGTNVTVYYDDNTVGGGHPDTALIAAFNSGQPVYLYMEFNGSGITTQGPYVVQVTSVGLASPPGQPRQFNYYTYTLPTSAAQYFQGSGHPSYTATYQQSLATLTTAVPVPGLSVGNHIVVSGVTPSAWNSTWTITQTLNSGSVTITQTSVTSNVATYQYTLVTGVAPSAGQLINITGTLNANGSLNGVNLAIVTASGGPSGSFTINITTPDSVVTAESGQGTTEGTIFAFDPGAQDVGTSTNPIFGNGTGGTLTFSANSATFITPGVKQGTIFWIDRNGGVTFPADPVTFTVPENTESISATLIPTGPPNIVNVGFSFTESGQNGVPGANFYFYDTAVSFTVNGVDYTATALIVPNGTQSANFSFPDSVLLASDEIDIQGNNYFNLREIGSPTWIFQYANRMMYGLCQTQLDNFRNLSFDGGYLPAPNPQPTFWTPVTPPIGVTVGLVTSPDFGDCIQVVNNSGSTVTNAYIYSQTAYQDFYNVPILLPKISYSIRFKARALNAESQMMTMALVPGIAGVPRGTVTFTVNQGQFTIQTAVIMTAQDTIPANLLLAIQIASIEDGAGVQIDRIEIFPTNHPVDTITIWTSYVDKFTAVDRVTGQLGCGADNTQSAQGAEQILEQLYIHKTASKCVTQDSPNYEPNQWNVPLASQGVGAVGPNAFYSDEEFDISVCRTGTFLFDGGKPHPISQELQSTGTKSSLFDIINWNAGHTIWLRYSTEKRELYIGVPLITPNFWLPNAPSLTPTSPNVVLMCNFNGCPTAEEFAASDPVHETMFGDLKAIDMRRKWSIWQMKVPAAEFITRQDGLSNPLFLCNGINSSKIYDLIDGAVTGGQVTDDGQPINALYTTYPFTKAKQGQQLPGLGALRKVWYYMACTAEGVGQLARKFYSNSLGASPQNTYTAPPMTLSSPAQNDQECVLELGGQRMFIEFSAVGTGGYFELGPIIVDGEMDKNAPHRGVSG